MRSVLGTAWLIARKDLRVEVRSRELVYTVLFFAIACLMVFVFALVRPDQAVDLPVGGILWIILVVILVLLVLGFVFNRR